MRNLADTAKRMFDFLQTNALGSVMPTAETSVICALYHMISANAEKRSRTAARKYNPYTDPLGGVVSQGIVSEFCDSIKDFWFEEKWGDCLTAPLQGNRDVEIRVPPALPAEICSS